MNLALIGFGAVARQFVDLVEAHREFLSTHHDLHPRVVGIVTGHGAAIDTGGLDTRRATNEADSGSLDRLHSHGGEPPPRQTRTFIDTVAATVEDVLVVENTPLGLDGGQPGVDHVRVALARGADVITANKGPVAFAFRELHDLSCRMNRAFLFEGSVLDGLPIFSLLDRTLPALRVVGFRGVVNTTTNHIVTAMESGLSIDEAVCEMQEAGITEADPTQDIDGWDAAAKAAALANVLMDARMTPHEVRRQSLRTVRVDDVRDARRRGTRIKLVASATRRDDAIVATVGPVQLDANDPLAKLDGTAKGLELDTDLLGPIQLSKSASGVEHTAYALFSDLVEVGRRRHARKGTEDTRPETA